MLASTAPTRRAVFLRLLMTLTLVVAFLPWQAATADAQTATGTIEVGAYGDRSGTGFSESAYAQGVGGTTFTFTWSGGSTSCQTTAGATCTAGDIPSGTPVTVTQDAPAGWRALPTLPYGGNSSGGGMLNPEPSYASRVVTLAPGQNLQLVGSGRAFTTANRLTTGAGFQTARTNPTLPSGNDVCNLRIAVLMDVSGSVGTAGVGTFRSGMQDFVDALRDTPHELAFFRFNSSAQVVGPNGVARSNFVPGTDWIDMSTDADDAYSRVTQTYTSGAGGQFPSASGTNYDAGFRLIDSSVPDADLLLHVTDGNPTHVANGSQNTTNNAGNNASYNDWFDVSLQDQTYGIAAANLVKANGTRIVAVGAGPVTGGNVGITAGTLAAVAGPTLNNDYYLGVFDEIGDLLADAVADLCSATVTVVKQLPNANADGWVSGGPGWEFTLAGDGLAPRTQTTGGNGSTTFTIPVDDLPASGLTVTETEQDGFRPVDASCDVATSPLPGVFGVELAPTLGLNDQASCTFRNEPLPEASIDVTKTADPTEVLTGQGTTWAITVENTGGTDLDDLRFGDTVTEACETEATDALLEAYADGILPVGQSFSFTCDSGAIDAETTNTFTATGTSTDPDVPGDVTDADDATVTPRTPAFTVEKSVDRSPVLVGGDVTWTVEVTNTGDTDLTEFDVEDVSGATDTDPQEWETLQACVDAGLAAAPATLAPGQNFTFDCAGTDLQVDTTNQVSVTATPQVGDQTGDEITGSDTAEVEVVDGSLAVTKSGAPSPVLAGNDATWTITVVNDGDVDLRDVRFTDVLDPTDDDVAAACVAAAEAALDELGTDGALRVDDVLTFTCDSEGLTADTTNTFTASGIPDVDGTDEDDRLDADASATVRVETAALSVTKDVTTPLVVVGGTVSWRITVANDGPVDLTAVEVADLVGPTGGDATTSDACVEAIEAQLDGTTLPAGASFTVDCETEDVAVGTTNTVTVTGTPSLDGQTGEPLTATDDAAARVIEFQAVVDEDATNVVGDDHTFTVDATYRINDGAWGDPVAVPDGTTLQVTHIGSDLVASTCHPDTDGTTDGTCTVTLTRDVPGASTLMVTGLGSTTVEGTTFEGSIVDAFTGWFTGDDATKTWVAYRVSVTPDEATNLADDDRNDGRSEHTFDVLVEEDRGQGWQPAPDVTIDVLGGQVDWTPDADTHVSDTCTRDGDEGGTDADGRCAIVVDSSEPGTTTVSVTAITAPDLDGAGTDEVTPTTTDATPLDVTEATGSKTWVRYAVDVQADAVNYVGDPHTFEVSVTRDAGEGPQPAAGVTASTSWTGHGSLIDGADCVTGADGTCEVTVDAATPGEGTLTVDHLQADDDITDEVDLDGTTTTSFAVAPADASKTWIDVDVQVAADAVNVIGDDHTFTVDVTVDAGDSQADLSATQIEVCLDWDGAGTPALDLSDCLPATIGEDGRSASLDVTVASPADPDLQGQGSLSVTAVTVAGDAYDDATWSFTLPEDGELTEGSTTSARKIWLGYDLAIDGPAENLVDDVHVFTLTGSLVLPDGVSVDESGVDLGEATVDVTVGGAGGQVSLPDDAAGPACTDGLSVAEDGRTGTCQVAVDSSEVGTTTVDASITGGAPDSGQVTTTQSLVAPGVKTWIDHELTVSPDAVNAVGDPHDFVFTVTQLRPDGDGGVARVPVEDLPVAVTLDGAGAITAAGGTTLEEPADAVDCPLTGGACTVTIVSDEVGTSQVSGEVTVEVAGTQRTYTVVGEDGEPVPAVKHWIDLDIVKDALVDTTDDGEDFVRLDDGSAEVPYRFTVTNPSPRDLDVTSLEDVFRDRGEPAESTATRDLLEAFTTANDGSTILASGGSVTFELTYTVSAEDAERGFLDNEVTVIGEDLEFPDEEATSRDDETVTLVDPAIALVKEALVDVGDDGLQVVEVDEDGTAEITYRFTLTNVGDIELTDLTLVDDRMGDLSDLIEVDSLGPGETTVVEAVYTTTTADLAAGSVTNVAVTTGTDRFGHEVEATDERTVDLVEVLAEVEVPADEPDAPDTDDDTEVLAERLSQRTATLPRTGTTVAMLVLLGLALALMGAGAVATTERRRRRA